MLDFEMVKSSFCSFVFKSMADMLLFEERRKSWHGPFQGNLNGVYKHMFPI